MKHFFLSCLLMLICCSITFAQQENSIWAFGSGSGLDFTSGGPVALSTSIDAREGTASVSSASGQLLFYTEGYTIWDRNGNPMPNGSVLTPFATTLTPSPTASSTQGSLIVPVPGSSSHYYVFSMTCLETGPDAFRLYYSIVDMNANGGLGDVIAGQKGILLDSMLSERLTAVVGDWCNIWLLTSSASGPAIKAFEITASGLNTTPVISPVMPGTAIDGSVGVLVVSPDGHKLAATQFGFTNGVTLFDFNNGVATNASNILPNGGAYGADFSPDNSKLYTIQDRLNQFDLSSNSTPAIIASRIVFGFFTPLSQIKRAPDGKLYFVGTATTMHQVSDPNAAGTACGIILNAVQISGSAMLGLPNVVPVMHTDTIYSSHVVKAACFSSEHVLQAQNTNNTWGHIWNSGATTPYLIADTPGLYWVNYRKSPCTTYVDTFKLLFLSGPLPQVTITASCAGSDNGKASVISAATDTNTYTFVWANAAGDTLSLSDSLVAAAAGSYTLRITSVFCDTILQVSIPEVDYKVSFNSNDILCEDTDMQLQNTSPNHFTSFLWNFGDGNISNLLNPLIRYADPGTYEITLTGTGPICSDTLKKQIVIDPLLSGHFETDRDSICTGEAIVFTVEGDSTLQRQYWEFGDGVSFNSTFESNTSHAYDRAGRWPVTLAATYRACPATFHADTVHIFPVPKVDLGPDTFLCLDGRAFHLKNKVLLEEGNYQYAWNTGSTDSVLKIVHPGTYKLSITAAPLGCSNTETVEVRKDCYIDMPNVFTPNGDGLNDYFFPRQLLSRSLAQFEMYVYNRWGQVVFHTRENNGRGWDGRFNNTEQPGGVYLYTVTATIEGRGAERYEGNVTLLR